jgi:hypothetical protein
LTQPKPDRFEILCHDIGLALLLGQKVQFALAHYFGVHQSIRLGLSRSQVAEKIRFFLSKPMGVVVEVIKRTAPLSGKLTKEVDSFKTKRNWLVHDFDEEATPHIAHGEQIDHYINIMEGIVNDAMHIMTELDIVGDDLLKEKSS